MSPEDFKSKTNKTVNDTFSPNSLVKEKKSVNFHT